ncbi:hypothetical protein GQ53DRAFT_749595 [Thozetella sp. PMI_491]|nr:hypothetical protein GQ53DRAFT_749595 [Thozetella sp. PMI_491]
MFSVVSAQFLGGLRCLRSRPQPLGSPAGDGLAEGALAEHVPEGSIRVPDLGPLQGKYPEGASSLRPAVGGGA